MPPYRAASKTPRPSKAVGRSPSRASNAPSQSPTPSRDENESPFDSPSDSDEEEEDDHDAWIDQYLRTTKDSGSNLPRFIKWRDSHQRAMEKYMIAHKWWGDKKSCRGRRMGERMLKEVGNMADCDFREENAQSFVKKAEDKVRNIAGAWRRSKQLYVDEFTHREVYQDPNQAVLALIKDQISGLPYDYCAPIIQHCAKIFSVPAVQEVARGLGGDETGASAAQIDSRMPVDSELQEGSKGPEEGLEDGGDYELPS